MDLQKQLYTRNGIREFPILNVKNELKFKQDLKALYLSNVNLTILIEILFITFFLNNLKNFFTANVCWSSDILENEKLLQF